MIACTRHRVSIRARVRFCNGVQDGLEALTAHDCLKGSRPLLSKSAPPIP